MSIRVMLDSDQPDVLLGSKASLVATYSDLLTPGLYAALAAGNRQVLSIYRGDSDPMDLATALDAGEGLVSLAEAPGWYDQRTKAGKNGLIVYCNRSQLAELQSLMGSRSYFRWLATLDGTAHIDGFEPGQGPALIQVLGEEQLGFHADLSLVFSKYVLPEPTVAQARAVAVQTQADAAAIKSQADRLLVLLERMT